jgi:hypothetical protein
MYTATGLRFLSSESVAHQSVVVGEPNGRHGIVKSELRRTGNGVEQKTNVYVKLPRTLIKKLNKTAVIGFTRMTDQEIVQEGMLLPFV